MPGAFASGGGIPGFGGGGAFADGGGVPGGGFGSMADAGGAFAGGGVPGFGGGAFAGGGLPGGGLPGGGLPAAAPWRPPWWQARAPAPHGGASQPSPGLRGMRSPFVTVDGAHVLTPEFERFLGWANLGLPPPPIMPRAQPQAAPAGNWSALPAPSMLPPVGFPRLDPAAATPWSSEARVVVPGGQPHMVEAAGAPQGRQGELPGELRLQPVGGKARALQPPQQHEPAAAVAPAPAAGAG